MLRAAVPLVCCMLIATPSIAADAIEAPPVARGLRSETMLHPMDGFSGRTYRAGGRTSRR